jgi:hypothetical protein
MPLRAVLAGLLWIASLWLLLDSLIFALSAADPEAGIARGCYTAIEKALGCKEPTLWIRPTEFGLGILLFLGIPVALGVSAVRAWKRGRHKAGDYEPTE